MNLQIALLLGQDGLTSGAIYALLALSIVLVFTVTRILLVPQGEFVTFGAMAMASLQAGQAPSLVSLLMLIAGLRLLQRIWLVRVRARVGEPPLTWRDALGLAYVGALAVALDRLAPVGLPQWTQVLFALAIVVPMGPWLYDLCFKPIAAAHSLVLLIVAIALHVALVGASLLMFGAEGARTEPFSVVNPSLGTIMIKSQTLWVLAATLVLIAGLYAYFERSIRGKALKATAVSRLGAQLMGISPEKAGRQCFLMAAFIGALSGILIAPITTLYYDSGFLICLKGFVAAVIGGLVSFPVAAVGALAVGMVEAFSTFWASAYKEVIVFTLILPVLLWRSLAAGHQDEEHA